MLDGVDVVGLFVCLDGAFEVVDNRQQFAEHFLASIANDVGFLAHCALAEVVEFCH